MYRNEDRWLGWGILAGLVMKAGSVAGLLLT